MPEIKFTSDVGEFPFAETRLPMLTRRHTNVRGNEQGGAYRKIDVTLSGYFTGESHSALKQKYETLCNVLAANVATLYYHDGTREVINQQVHIDSVSDPTFKKQFILDYTINCYYYKEVNQAGGITASYSSDAGSFPFPITPAWEFTDSPNRDHPLSPTTTLAGLDMGSIVHVTLTGTVYGDSASALETKRQSLMTALSKDGTLNYGDFSAAVKVGAKRIPSVTPLNFFNYSIDFDYFAPGLVEFKATRSISRTHSNPIVRENPSCGTAYVLQRSSTGQYIDYHIRAGGSSLSDIRSRLETELSYLVVDGGVEMPGGRETQEHYPPSVDCSFTKYYTTPVISNLGS